MSADRGIELVIINVLLSGHYGCHQLWKAMTDNSKTSKQ